MSTRLPTPEDATVAAQIVELACDMVRHGQPSGRRDAHVKHHGLVLAEMRIRPDLPSDLRHGLLARSSAEAPPYRAYIRFSNAAPHAQSDATPDAHGMAIKLLGVPGAKLLDDEHDTFDLLLVDHPIFFLANLRIYLQFVRIASGRARWWEKLLFLLQVGTVWRMLRSRSRIPSPLSTTYFSMTAYKLGPHAIKWLARPLGAAPTPLPPVLSNDYLRRTMARELASAERYFELCVQLCTAPESMPVDDPTIDWPVTDSRPIPVATIRIPRQRFEAREQMGFAESISFNPWRVMAEHAPLGRINQLRLSVYTAVASLRHQLGGVTSPPPALHDWDQCASSILE